MTCSLKSFNAVTVEWSLRKPCWKTGISRDSVSVGRIRRSRIFIAGQSKETGLKEFESFGDLLGLSRGIMIEVFHMSGIMPVLMDRLNILVR